MTFKIWNDSIEKTNLSTQLTKNKYDTHKIQ